MARWDKFLNAASEGYGTGFKRYEQYADARDERLDRADNAAIVDLHQQMRDNKAVLGEGTTTTTYRDVPAPKVSRTAVQTGKAAAPTTRPPEYLDRNSRPAPAPARATSPAEDGTRALPSTANPLTPMSEVEKSGAVQRRMENYPPELRDAMRKQHRGVEIAAGEGAFGGGPPLRAPEEKATKEAVPDATKKGEAETAIKEAESLAENVGTLVPAQKEAVKEAVETVTREYKMSGDMATADVWNAIEDRMMAIAVRNGDTEAIIGMPKKIAAMQQERAMTALQQAMQVLGTDPEEAGRLLTKGYSYYPDGIASQFRIKDGQLYGYGFDEATGEFKGGQAITPEGLAAMMEKLSDPVQFYKDVRATRLAAEQRKYEREKDEKQYNLDSYNAKSKAALYAARAFLSRAQGNEIYADKFGLNFGSVASWPDGAETVAENKSAAVDAYDAMYQNKTWPSPMTELLSGEDGLGYHRMVGIIDSLAGNVAAHQNIGMAVVPGIATAIGELELVNSQVKSGKAEQDRILDTIAKHDIKLNGINTTTGNLNLTVNGMPVELRSDLVPGIERYLEQNPTPPPAGAKKKKAAPSAVDRINEGQTGRTVAGRAIDAVGGAVDAVNAAQSRAGSEGVISWAARTFRSGLPLDSRRVAQLQKLLTDPATADVTRQQLKEQAPELLARLEQ